MWEWAAACTVEKNMHIVEEEDDSVARGVGDGTCGTTKGRGRV